MQSVKLGGTTFGAENAPETSNLRGGTTDFLSTLIFSAGVSLSSLLSEADVSFLGLAVDTTYLVGS